MPGAGDRGHGALLLLLSSTGGDFKSFPGHQWHLYPRSLSMELPAGPKQLSTGMPILPLAFLWAPALGVSHMGTVSHQGVLPIAL